MKKRILTVLLTGALIAGALSACGSSTSTKQDAAKTDNTTKTAETKELEPLTVAASETPHSEILEQAKAALAEKGYDLQVTVFDDYIQPNAVVESGEIDANYFQHQPYLDYYNKENSSNIVSVGKIHYEPLGIYPGTKSTLEEIADGDVIAVPNDTTNEARALLLLEANGLIKLKKGAGLEATIDDIADNPHKIKIEELEAAQVARVKDEVAYVVLNGNFALQAGFSVAKDAIAYEQADSQAASTYANIVAVKAGNENEEKIKALVEVLGSDEIKNYITNTYDGAVIPYAE
ncbi:MAG: MetQ/NlpA family ABC transporter substrate-binding protein [Candidatus Metalachnospira sp.]|nr:MetQ/NlpA family ABC transporter substrate-binding protein [Candidatus Metalachnospira sp.]